MTEWQPIETAEPMKKRPDDPEGRWMGPSLLLWVIDDFYIGSWDPETFCSKPKPHWHYHTHRGKTWMRANQPTHWMLPSAPDMSGQSEERSDTALLSNGQQPDTQIAIRATGGGQ
jgi:hypothetical protein